MVVWRCLVFCVAGLSQHGVLLSKPLCANAANALHCLLPTAGEGSIAFNVVSVDVHGNHW